MSKLKKIQELIEVECDCIKEMLLDKNRAYGNSAIEPLRIFSKSDFLEQINVRIDDKLSRIKNNKNDDEDAELDLLGYIILKRVAKVYQEETEDLKESFSEIKTLIPDMALLNSVFDF